MLRQSRLVPALLASAIVGTVVLTAVPAHASSFEYSVPAGTRLVPGDRLASTNRAYTLTVQTDGNVVERRGATAVWTTNTPGNPGAVLDVQTDGNLVVRSAGGRALWTSGTPGHRNAELVLDDSGEVRLAAGAAYWTNGVDVTAARSSLTAGQSVRSGDVNPSVVSPTSRIRLTVGSDQLALSDEPAAFGALIWLRRVPAGSAVLTMQTDGNLVLRGADGAAAWASGTRGAGNRMLVQDDGNLVVRRPDGSAAWSTGTTRVLLAAGEAAPAGTRFVVDRSVLELGGLTVVQSDGNVVSRTGEGRLLWNTGTSGNPGARLVLQTDGNLVVRRPDGRAVWQSGTSGCEHRPVLDTSHGWLYELGTIVWTTTGGKQNACSTP